MKKPIHILQLEDTPNDTLLVQMLLEREGYVCDMVRVETRGDFTAALQNSHFDLILSDMKLPAFDGIEALKIAKAMVPETPFILVSGTMGEETAIDSLLQGATDYVLKTRMARLVPAVRRALEESAERANRRRAEASLKKFSALLEQTADSLVITDRAGIIEYVNPAFERVTGYSQSEAIGQTPALLKSGEHPREFYESMWGTILSGKVFRAEFRNRRKNGELYYQDETITPVADALGQITHFVSTGRDISEKIRAEQALVESEERFRMLFEFSPDAYFLMDQSGIFVDGNKAAETLFEYTREELAGKNFFKLGILTFSDLSRAANIVAINGLGKPTGPNEFSVKSRSGKDLKIELRTLPMKVGGRPLIVTIARDITERKNVEDAMRASEVRFRSVWEHSADGMRLTDHEGRIVEVNDAFCKLVKIPRENLVGQLFSVIYKRGGRDDNIALYQARYASGTIVPSLEASVTLWNGDVCDLELSNSFITTGVQDKMILSVFRDVTARNKAERQSALLAQTLRSARDCICVMDNENRILFVNEAFSSTYGYSEDELLGKNISIIWTTTEASGRQWDVLPATMQGGWHGELMNRRKDGSEFPVEIWTSVVRDGEGQPVALVGIARDISERLMVEEQLRQMQKMESIGTLAGGIAHDFNNMLGIILGHTTMLEHSPGDAEMVRYRTNAINTAVQRGADLVRQILTFARKTTVHLTAVNINDAVSELVRMLNDTFPRTIEITLDLDDTVPTLQMDPTQLRQALLNLCVNARDAMTAGQSADLARGVLSVSTCIVHGAELRRRFVEASAERYACVAVSDTGIGIDEPLRDKIFEPFFTTKGQGKGTGLGLSVVYGIIRGHHGHIDVASEVGHGSTFRMYLPIAGPPSAVHGESSTASGKARGGTETVLLVEDEVELLDMMASELHRKGYNVITAKDGVEAMEVFMRGPGRIDLVLSDVGLPRLDGAGLFAALREYDPSIRFVLASGYLEPTLKSDLLAAGANAFIQKPYNPAEVTKLIREVLDLSL